MYDRGVIKTTKEAIIKWEKICYFGGEDKDCSLCDRFCYSYNDEIGEEGCWGCPIYDFTGTDCMGLPNYLDWISLFSRKEPKQVIDKASLKAAQAELAFIKKIFIKSLLLWELKKDFFSKKPAFGMD